jgi:hypothetical protein
MLDKGLVIRYFPQGVPAFYRIAFGYRSAKAKGKSQKPSDLRSRPCGEQRVTYATFSLL